MSTKEKTLTTRYLRFNPKKEAQVAVVQVETEQHGEKTAFVLLNESAKKSDLNSITYSWKEILKEGSKTIEKQKLKPVVNLTKAQRNKALVNIEDWKNSLLNQIEAIALEYQHLEEVREAIELLQQTPRLESFAKGASLED